MIEALFCWPPLLWTARVTTAIVFAAIGLATFLFFARFLRPKHIWAMLTADIPRVSEIGAEVGGNKVAFKLDRAQEEQIRALKEQVDLLEGAIIKIEERETRKEVDGD